MPNFIERFNHWRHDVFGSDELVPVSSLVKDQNARLLIAGINIGENNRRLSCYLETLSDQELSILGKITDQHVWFFGSYHDHQEATYTAKKLGHLLTIDANDQTSESQKIENVKTAISEFVTKSELDFQENAFNRYVLALARIVCNPVTYQFFDQDPALVGRKALVLFDDVYDPNDIVTALFRILSNARKPEDFKPVFDMDPKQIRLILEYTNVFGNHPEAIKIYDEFCRSKQNWGDRYAMFQRLCAAVGGLPLTFQSLSDLLVQRMSPAERKRYHKKDSAGKFLTIGTIRRKLGHNKLREISTSDHNQCSADTREQLKIARNIAKWEDPDLPIITMNIAATLGNEIEFPFDTEEIYDNIPADLETLTDQLGIHWGGGGEDCAEIAPGPFYHPETMVAYFRLMQDLGFIDFTKYQGLTLHFNSGVQRRGLCNLILGQYLANTISSTSMFSDDSREDGFKFKIFDTCSGQVEKYTECKSFLCITPFETELGLIQAGYLSWALKCYQRIEDSLDYEGVGLLTPTKIQQSQVPIRVKQMAQVYFEYITNLDLGARTVGLRGLTHMELSQVPARKLNKMISLVQEAVPDYRSRFNDPNSINTQNPVIIGDRHWPNVVAFARSLGNDAVSKIKKIERGVNTDAKNRILEINRSSDSSTRRIMIQAFLDEFKPNKIDISTPQDELGEVNLTALALGLKNVKM